MTPGRSSRVVSVGFLASAILFQFALVAPAQTSAWDPGLSKDLFKDDLTPKDAKNPKKPQKPTHRLAPTTCDDCQKIVDQLQAALDDWYALELADANDTISLSVQGKPTAVSQTDARAQKEDALAGLGQKERAPPKGKSRADVKKEIKKLSDALTECLKKCAPSPTPTPTPTPTPNDGKQPGDAGQPPPANAPQPAGPGPKPECVLKIDFIINRGATLDSEGAGKQTQAEEEKKIDDYLQKLNKTFSASGVGFERNSLTHVNDPKRPEYPETGGEENKASKEQIDVAKEAEAEAKKLKNKGNITVKIVHNFRDADKPNGSPASIQGITIGRTILIVDPWDVKRNTLGGETWDHTLAHELGHRLGLDHTILASDKDYENQEKGVYKPPNVMSPGHGRTDKPDEFTPDQIAEMKKRYENEFCKPGQTQPAPTPTPPPSGGGGKSKTPTPKPGRPKRAPRVATGGGVSYETPADDFCAQISEDKIKIDTVGTGETIGHVADLIVENLTDQPIEVAIPPMILESRSGKNQHYAIPKGETVEVPPHETKKVPVDGVCLVRNRPPVGDGVLGDLAINDCDPNAKISHDKADLMRRIAKSKYDAADKLEEDGLLKDMPYKDRKKRKEIVEQWSVWADPRISEITGNPPATKDDLKKVVYKQLETRGPLSPETKKKVDQGIDTIFEKVELTTVKAKELEEAEQGPKIEGAPPFNQPQTVGGPGPGNQPFGGPKGGAKGKGNEAAAVCSDCASPVLTVTYDTQTNEVKAGPYGATSMGKPPYDLTVEGGCITCGKDNICCCAITKINVVLHFQINVNTDKIDKGVWMNTADDPKKLGKTKTTAPKDGDKDKDEWKKVDKDSVVKHEKTHCDDLRKAIEDNLKEGLKGSAFTPSMCPDKDCKQDNDACKKVLNDAKANIDTRMNANIDVVVKKLTEMEKEGYPGGEMEQNARKAQAKDLNDRNK